MDPHEEIKQLLDAAIESIKTTVLTLEAAAPLLGQRHGEGQGNGKRVARPGGVVGERQLVAGLLDDAATAAVHQDEERLRRHGRRYRIDLEEARRANKHP